MTPSGEPHGRPQLNESQQRRLLVTCQYVDRLLVDIETILTVAASRSPFARYRDDLAPGQRRLLQDYLERIRSELLRVLARHGLEPAGPPVSVTHAVRTTLGFVDIAVEELRPTYMRGYGALPPELVPELDGLVEELRALVLLLDAALAERVQADFEARLGHLEAAGQDVSVVQAIARIVSRYGLVEFRPALALVLDRLEDRAFEIAVFGRVSSGKSSLLNYVLGASALPVGVTPITTVPTRIVHGPEPEVVVDFADRRRERVAVARLHEFATEQGNPGNAKHVTRIVVALPSPRLQRGVVFVDTPGLGSLASRGAEETMAYLPRCDLAVVLIDATAPLTIEDVGVLDRLRQAAIPATVLLSKADLLSAAEVEQVQQYVESELAARLGARVPVRPISVAPGAVQLADAWVAGELQRVLDEHARLADRSLRRKMGALKTNVEAALRARLDQVQRWQTRSAAEHQAVETALRAAAAAFETTRRALEPFREVPPDLIQSAVEAAARAAVGAGEAGVSGLESLDESARRAVERLAAARAEEASRRVGTLAEQAAAALKQAAHALGLPEPSRDDVWTTGARELPPIDLRALRLSVRPPSIAWLLGRRAAAWWAARVIGRRDGAELRAALETHAVLVHSWAMRTLGALRRAFEAEAQIARAHLGGPRRDDPRSPEDPEALARDLEALAGRPVLEG